MHPNGIVTLLTDFGITDPYVGAMKGSLLSIDPTAQIVDISHGVPALAIGAGAFVAGATWPYFPPGTVHVAVVDPGVGTDRAAVVVETSRGYFVGPDNGLLSPALPASLRPTDGLGRVAFPAGYRAFELTNPDYQRQPVSNTFHGRDIFAPAAAHLLRGVKPEQFGASLADLLLLPEERAARVDDGTLEGSVIYVDRFGNLITNVRWADLTGAPRIEVGGTLVREGLVRTYGEIERLAAVVSSLGYVEIAGREASAASILGVSAGERVVVRTG